MLKFTIKLANVKNNSINKILLQKRIQGFDEYSKYKIFIINFVIYRVS
jgi:hypothetical protein